MSIGPGKYDDLCTHVREQASAAGVVIMIIGGEHGSGFSVQGDETLLLGLPRLLEELAGQIRKGMSEKTQ